MYFPTKRSPREIELSRLDEMSPKENTNQPSLPRNVSAAVRKTSLAEGWQLAFPCACEREGTHVPLGETGRDPEATFFAWCNDYASRIGDQTTKESHDVYNRSGILQGFARLPSTDARYRKCRFVHKDRWLVVHTDCVLAIPCLQISSISALN